MAFFQLHLGKECFYTSGNTYLVVNFNCIQVSLSSINDQTEFSDITCNLVLIFCFETVDILVFQHQVLKLCVDKKKGLLDILCFSGFGGLGPIIEGPIVGWIADRYGWTGPFYLMVAMSLLGSLTMLKATRIDQSLKEAQFMGTLSSADV